MRLVVHDYTILYFRPCYHANLELIFQYTPNHIRNSGQLDLLSLLLHIEGKSGRICKLSDTFHPSYDTKKGGRTMLATWATKSQ